MSDSPLSETATDAVEALLDEVTAEPQPLLQAENLSGKVAIVSGGSRGIGRAVALELARCGTHVAFCYLDVGDESRREAEEVASELRQMEVRVFFRSCDVRESSEVGSFVAETDEELGGIDVLVNNAGIGRDSPMWRMADHDWEAVIRTNLDGAFYFTRAVAPFMRAQEYGKIVNITSVYGIRTEFGISNYSSSKAGLIGLTRSSAVELGPKNINVNAVAPGYVRTTRLTEGVSPEILDRARERSALGRLGDPRDVAGVVLFLCSEAARHITGAVITVDGGYVL
ncbi:MAG TPA: 3-oxoacyl-ACP reductase FabG [Gemmatimonadetes bacterium]|jgi:3-oxoacyl-[acyl-carrier protein] reductase|nr:3-oxoacyl-ACP reductase FabG [Gemmatimonadota bacterium]HIB10182.1 3-oxoacyl-ACP reductase FabG [Gemmatimonadota bacterium]HIN79190.1 3-oxoacyl-ACP reductase FabG [Gemmatimonadota bacterium]